MIHTFSSTIRRKEMDAVLTCMVDERIGPGDLNVQLIQYIKDFFSCAGALAFRSPATALCYALKAAGLHQGDIVMMSSLSPLWQMLVVQSEGYKTLFLDVDDNTGLVSADAISEGAKRGGTFLLLHETMGIVPDIESIRSCGIPFIEDISQSAGATFTSSSNDIPAKKAGSFGMFTLLGLEEHDIITGGGGAVLFAHGAREWAVLKKYTESVNSIDLLPDINSALALVQIKEYKKNEEIRKEMYNLFMSALKSSKNRTFIHEDDNSWSAWSFPVILAGSFNDARQYAARKDVEIRLAYENAVISSQSSEVSPFCKKAAALSLRTALFPMYPRLGKGSVEKIAKVLSTLP